MSELTELKLGIRDINLAIVMNNFQLDCSPKRRFNKKFQILYPSRTLIKYITKIGGVLTGSRALRCWSLSGVPILQRGVHDWDFVVTQEMAWKICAKMRILELPKTGETISIKNQRWWSHPAYSDSYRVGPVDVQMIVSNELPEFQEFRGIRIASFVHSLTKKLEVATELQGSTSVEGLENYHKHIRDLKEIIIKFNSQSNEKCN